MEGESSEVAVAGNFDPEDFGIGVNPRYKISEGLARSRQTA